MRVVLDLTPSEYRAGHDLIAFVLRRAGTGDPDLDDLRSFFFKLEESSSKALCKECRLRRVYASGKCEPCYREAKRKAS